MGTSTDFSYADRTRPMLIALLLLISLTILVRTAWVCDDAYITFRVVDNFVHGEGLRWNTDERVQAFTNPLWTLAMSAFYAITGDIYYTSIFVSMVLALLTLYLIMRYTALSIREAVIGALILISSKAFIDYSTSGLENPLTNVLLATFLVLFFTRRHDTRGFFWLCLVASLGALNRLDTILLYLPALVFVFFRLPWKRAFWTGVKGFSPLIAWEIFALIYYGFPFPNTYYAKLHAGIPASELMEQGFIYFLHTFNADPLTLIAITTALIFVVLMRTRDKLPIAIGVLLYLIYIMRIGGDFMSGRFFAAPLVMSVGLLTRYRLPSIPATIVAAAAVVLMGWIPESPNLLSDSQYGKGGAPGIQDTGIVDERAWYYPETGLLRKSRKKNMPAHHWLRRGVENRWKERRVKSASVIGFEGFASGPDVHIIDGYALTDPLLARLPTYRKRDWRTGHYSRSLPAGYLASIRSGKNLVADSSVAAYWDKLVWITRGKVFRMGRFVRIVKMNLGLYDGLLYDYLHPPRLYAKYADISTPVGRGTPWDCDQCVEIRTSGIEIALDSMCRSERIELSVDHNDHYRLALYHDSTEVGFIKIKRVKIPEGGLRVDTVVVPETALWAGYNRLWLYAWTGDDMYSLGHIRLLDDKGK